jgi:PIN domain nuclease of toxin-antitoxin system
MPRADARCRYSTPVRSCGWRKVPNRSRGRHARPSQCPGARLFVSAITAFELGVKHRRGALTLPLAPLGWYERALAFHDLEGIPVNGRIAMRSTELPRLHDDPCDRIIIATAQRDGLVVLTPDRLIRAYPKTQTCW